MPDRVPTIALPPDLEAELHDYGDLEFDTECAVRSRMLAEHHEQMRAMRRNPLRFLRNLANLAVFAIVYILGLHALIALLGLFLLPLAVLYYHQASGKDTSPPRRFVPRRDAKGHPRLRHTPHTCTPTIPACWSYIQVLVGGFFVYYAYSAGLLPGMGERARKMLFSGIPVAWHEPWWPLAIAAVVWLVTPPSVEHAPPRKTVQQHMDDYCSHVQWPLSSPRLRRP
ncbi:hypothetical protein C2E23DRAFT_882721 [Lenzites betulinus]|nr:hypothetical protein C2E23DRAFT_882721 [Lenzites betulinus]